MFKHKKEVQKKNNILDEAKLKMEKFSGLSFDDVKVNFNSDKPKKLNAYAFTQGTNVYISPGNEKYLNHELRHVIQQKEGRVPLNKNRENYPVVQIKNLELEADKPIQLAPLIYNDDQWAPPQLAAMRGVETKIRPRLAQIPYRYGGSFAAFLTGGKRIPQDIDIEVQKDEDIKNAADRLLDLAVYSDIRKHGSVMQIESTVLTPILVNVDIVNENDTFFNQTLKTVGHVHESGEIVDYEDLVLNYLERLMITPGRAKQDEEQIKGILEYMCKQDGYNMVKQNMIQYIHLRTKSLSELMDSDKKLPMEIINFVTSYDKGFRFFNGCSAEGREKLIKRVGEDVIEKMYSNYIIKHFPVIDVESDMNFDDEFDIDFD